MEQPRRNITIIFGGVVATIAIIISTILVLSGAGDDNAVEPAGTATANEIQGGPILATATSSISSANQGPPDGSAGPQAESSLPAEETSSGGLEPGNGTPTAEPFVTHVIQSGDNLYDLSIRYGVEVEEIAALNQIDAGQILFPGEELLIPVQPTPTALPPSETDEPLLAGGNPTSTFTRPPPPPTITPTPSPTSPATPLPTIPAGVTVNGLPLESIIVMPDDVLQNVRQIYGQGQELGRDPQAFSKVGDSTIQIPYFLARFEESDYNLGDYAYLQPVIDHFRGSFGRDGMSVKRGMHSWTVLDPLWADKDSCQPNETPLDCELRLHNPSLILIRLGANDAGVPAGFDVNVRQVVEYLISQGVVPVIGTKADRFEGPENINNEILRQVAADFKLPLWDFDVVAGTLPGRGLDVDNVHMTTFYAHDYTSPTAFERGHSVHNLTALIVLDTLWREVILVD